MGGRTAMTEKERDPDSVAQLRLQAVLAEYNARRAENLQKFGHHLQLYSFVTTGVMVVIGWAVSTGTYDVLLGVPVLSTAFALRYLWEQAVIVRLGDYIRLLEEHTLPSLIGTPPPVATGGLPLWVGWQHYWDGHAPPSRWFKVAIVIVAVGIPFLPALTLAGVTLIQTYVLGSAATATDMPTIVHVVAIPLYGLLAAWLVTKLWEG